MQLPLSNALWATQRTIWVGTVQMRKHKKYLIIKKNAKIENGQSVHRFSHTLACYIFETDQYKSFCNRFWVTLIFGGFRDEDPGQSKSPPLSNGLTHRIVSYTGYMLYIVIHRPQLLGKYRRPQKLWLATWCNLSPPVPQALLCDWKSIRNLLKSAPNPTIPTTESSNPSADTDLAQQTDSSPLVKRTFLL